MGIKIVIGVLFSTLSRIESRSCGQLPGQGWNALQLKQTLNIFLFTPCEMAKVLLHQGKTEVSRGGKVKNSLFRAQNRFKARGREKSKQSLDVHNPLLILNVLKFMSPIII